MKSKHKIYLLIGYGEESETFIRARKAWTSYLKNNHDVSCYFNVLVPEISSDAVIEKDKDLIVGCRGLIPEGNIQSNYDNTLRWSESERIKSIHRRIRTIEYLLSVNNSPFWIVNTTVTSAISLSRLICFLNYFQCSNFLAGAPIFKEIPYSEEHFVMLSGAGQIMSSDIAQLVVDRKKSLSLNMLDDIWISLILNDISRTLLKRYDFTAEVSYTASDQENIQYKIQEALEEGHMHFRVKNINTNNIKREDIDPLILKKIFDEIASLESKENMNAAQLIEFHAYQNSYIRSGNLPSVVKLPYL